MPRHDHLGQPSHHLKQPTKHKLKAGKPKVPRSALLISAGSRTQLRKATEGFQPIACRISPNSSEYDSTALNWGNCFLIASGAWKRKPTWASPSMAVSLKESPAAMT